MDGLLQVQCKMLKDMGRFRCSNHQSTSLQGNEIKRMIDINKNKDVSADVLLATEAEQIQQEQAKERDMAEMTIQAGTQT